MDPVPTDDWLPHRNLDEPTADWVARLREDMQARWRAGRPARLEEYLGTFPELLVDRDAVLDLIAQERLLRAEAGEVPGAEEYAARYLAWGPEIRDLFLVEEGIVDLGAVEEDVASSDPTDVSGAGDTPPPVPSRFTFTRWLGSGGFGRVGLYRDLKLQRPVALKFIRSAGAGPRAATRLARFRQEAALAAKLNHPSVCILHDFDFDHDPPYLVFEYVDGKTLREVLTDGPLPLDQAVQIVRDVADAMAHCHAHKSIHRDLKPENIKRRANGRVKVLDFGLARPLDTDERLTSPDTVAGTLDYSSPEQIRAQGDAGPPSDQFSLGVVFYELLTGRRPFEGATVGELLGRITDRPPAPPREHRPELDAAIVSIVLRLLEKDPRDRFDSMADVRDVLNGYLEGNRQPVPRRSRLTRRIVVRAGGLLVATAAALGMWRALRPDEPAPDRNTQSPLPQPQPPQSPRASEGVGPAPDLAALLGRIATDLAAVDERRQPFQRYFSLAHLVNDGRVSPDERQRVRDALIALLPKLSATGELIALEPVAGDPSLLRVDLRALGWVPTDGGQWEAVVRRYPYSLRYSAADLEPAVRAGGSTIRKLLDSDLTPFLLADWFVATASDDPLADELLRLTCDESRETRRGAIRLAELLTRVRSGYVAAPVDLLRARAELGLSAPERLRELLLGKEELATRLGVAPWLRGDGVSRAVWLRSDLDNAPFAELATELKLGVRRILR